MEQLIARIIRASWMAKIGVLAGAIAFTTAVTWYVFVLPAQEEITRVEAQRQKLEGEFIDKQQIANNLNEYRKQKELLEAKLKDALLELPNDRAIDELLRQLDDVGVESGLQITLVEPQGEKPAGFFARIPVKMKVTGNYLEIASFFAAIGKLKRIVNVNDLHFSHPREEHEKVLIDAEFLATTFRFREPAKGKKGKKGKK